MTKFGADWLLFVDARVYTKSNKQFSLFKGK